MAPDQSSWIAVCGAAVALLATGAGASILRGLDANRDGAIDSGEWRGVYASMGAAPVSRATFAQRVPDVVASPLFTLWDLNGDDRLSGDEWDAALGLMDANHDEVVTPDEIDAEIARSGR